MPKLPKPKEAFFYFGTLAILIFVAAIFELLLGFWVGFFDILLSFLFIVAVWALLKRKKWMTIYCSMISLIYIIMQLFAIFALGYSSMKLLGICLASLGIISVNEAKLNSPTVQRVKRSDFVSREKSKDIRVPRWTLWGYLILTIVSILFAVLFFLNALLYSRTVVEKYLIGYFPSGVIAGSAYIFAKKYLEGKRAYAQEPPS